MVENIPLRRLVAEQAKLYLFFQGAHEDSLKYNAVYKAVLLEYTQEQ
jgi:hypothetical protein